MKKILIFIALSVSPFYLQAQELSNLRQYSLIAHSDTLILDSLSIVPGSLIIRNEQNNIIPDNLYNIDYINAKLHFLKADNDTILLIYRVFSAKLNERFQIRKAPQENQKVVHKQFLSDTKSSSQSFLNSSNINKSGSISRGLSVGNNNDASVSSDMNLQLSGEIAPGVVLRAALSDDNIPVQADGTTQHIREFDRVFIELESPESKLTAGDYNTELQNGIFLNTKRKVQGIKYRYTKQDSIKRAFMTEVNLSVSKGKFRRMKFSGSEGNQGPYRLSGNNDDYFIIVLAGSEKIFVNGKLLERGKDNDYIMNYNSAELIFTSNFQITKDSRIVAEFEYSDKNYMRFLVGGQTLGRTKKGSFFVNYLSENDAKNQSLTQELSDEQKVTLRDAGDSPFMAVVPSETLIDTIDENRIGYIKKDSIINGIIYKDIFEHSITIADAQYYVQFSFTGTNKGNYKRVKSGINGKIFKWVAPIDSIPQGNYAPFKQLISPKSKMMITTGGNYTIGKKTDFHFETAFTNSDDNLFSEIDDNNNVGYAVKAGLTTKIDRSKNSSFIINTNYIKTGQNFMPFENFRSTEFERDYNISELPAGNGTQQISVSGNLLRKNGIDTKLSTNLFNIDRLYRASKTDFNFNFRNKKISLGNEFSFLVSEDTSSMSQFVRYNSFIEKDFRFSVFGLKDAGERNIFKNNDSINLMKNSYRFNEFTVYMKNPTSFKRTYMLSYTNREDFAPQKENLKFVNQAHDFSLQSSPLNNRNQRMKIAANYRILSVNDTSVTEERSMKSFAGNLNYNLSFLNNGIVIAVFAEHKAGSRMKQDFTYIEVADGQGVFTWQDFNENGLKETDEFMKTQFADEADYIRIILPTDEYIQNYEQKADFSLLINPHRFWNNKKGIQGFLARFSERVLLQPGRSFDPEISPISIAIQDSMLFGTKSNMQNIVSFKTNNSKFRTEHLYKQSKNRDVLINGRSEYSDEFQKWSMYYFFGNFSFSPVFTSGEKNRNTEYPKTGNYNISYNRISFETKYNNSKYWEIISILSRKTELNTEGIEHLTSYNAGLNIIFKTPTKRSLNTEIKFIRNDFEGENNTAVAYEMMEGLKPENNFTWTLGLTQKLSDYLQLNIIYSGRKSEDVKFIHTGNLSIRALF